MTIQTDPRDWTEWGWPRPPGTDIQLIVVHRTGNPNAGVAANLNHSRNTKSWSIHHIVGPDAAVNVVPHRLVAWHVKEPLIAQRAGFPYSFPDGSHSPRGDVAAIGIEVCEDDAVERQSTGSAKAAGEKVICDIGEKTGPLSKLIRPRSGNPYYATPRMNGDLPAIFTSPGATTRFSPAVYSNLVDLLTALRQRYPNAQVVGHGHLDPWTRTNDPFGLLPGGWEGLLAQTDANQAPKQIGDAPGAGDSAYVTLLGKRVSALEAQMDAIHSATE